ncbi:MAG: WD40 repeat domain-containing protein [Gemmataceae bacterium]
MWTIAFSPDGRLVVSEGDDHVIHVWDVLDGKEVRQLKGFNRTVRCLRFSPDSKALACGLRLPVRPDGHYSLPRIFPRGWNWILLLLLLLEV